MLTKHHFHRLAGLWEEEVRSRGDGASLRRVVWRFCRTRLLLSILCLMVTQLAGFSGPVSNTISGLLCLSGVFSLDLSLSLSLLLSLCIISFIDPPIKSCPPQMLRWVFRWGMNSVLHCHWASEVICITSVVFPVWLPKPFYQLIWPLVLFIKCLNNDLCQHQKSITVCLLLFAE